MTWIDRWFGLRLTQVNCLRWRRHIQAAMRRQSFHVPPPGEEGRQWTCKHRVLTVCSGTPQHWTSTGAPPRRRRRVIGWGRTTWIKMTTRRARRTTATRPSTYQYVDVRVCTRHCSNTLTDSVVPTTTTTMTMIMNTSSVSYSTWWKCLYDIALYGKPISELQNVTCYMGSHCVACHSTQVNAPPA